MDLIVSELKSIEFDAIVVGRNVIRSEVIAHGRNQKLVGRIIIEKGLNEIQNSFFLCFGASREN